MMDATTSSESDIDAQLQKNGLVLRDHQKEGIEFLMRTLKNGHGAILADEMGLGKTCQSVVTLVTQGQQLNMNGPHLVVCPLSVLETWSNEIKRFGCGLKVVLYRGTKEERIEQRADWLTKTEIQQQSWHIFLTTYEMIVHDAEYLNPVQWQSVVIDEAHRVKNSQSLLHNQIRLMSFKWLLLLTGTPVQNNLQELHSLLTLVAPDKYPLDDQQKFVQKYIQYKNKQAMDDLRQVLSQYMIRRTKDTIALDIPAKHDLVLYHGISTIQKKVYKAILVKNHEAFDNTSSRQQQSLMNVLIQLRKCVAHPYLFDGIEPEPFEEGEHLVEASDKLVVLDHLLRFCESRGHRVLLFSQMTRVLDILQDYLTFRGYSYERLDGSVRSDERFAAVRQFNAKDSSTFVFLLSTRAGGLGLTLTAADTVIFYDSDFNPQNDLQAAARAHRIGQTKPVKIIRLIGQHTVEEIIESRAAEKLRLTHAVIGHETDNTEDAEMMTASELSKILTHGLQKLTKDDDSDVDKRSMADVYKDMEKHLLRVLGDTDENGCWMRPVDASTPNPDQADQSAQPVNMYVYEGTDYKKIREQKEKEDMEGKALADRAALQLLLDEGKQTYGAVGGKRGNPNKKKSADEIPLEKLGLTPEQLEERRKKLAEAAERARLMAAERQRLAREQRQHRLRQKWADNGYTSTNLATVPDNEQTVTSTVDLTVDDSDETDAGSKVYFVHGNVAQPTQQDRDGQAKSIILHVVDNSGRWGRGGVFDALKNVYEDVGEKYEKAFEMSDLKLGDAHLMQMGDNTFVCLLVVQSKANRDTLSMSHFGTALASISHYIRQQADQSFSVHIARIGYGMPSVRWYTVERMLYSQLCRRAHVNTYVYYYNKAVHSQIKRAPVPAPDYPSTSSNGVLDDQATGKKPRLDEGQVDSDSEATASLSSTLPPKRRSSASLLDHSYLTGVRLYIDDTSVDATKKSYFTRVVTALGGDVMDVTRDNCTHFLCADEDSTKKAQSLLGEYQRALSLDELRDCIRNKQAP